MVIARTRIGKLGRPLGGIPAIVIAQAIVIASYAGVIARTRIGKPWMPMGGTPAIVIAQAIAIASYARVIFIQLMRRSSASHKSVIVFNFTILLAMNATSAAELIKPNSF